MRTGITAWTLSTIGANACGDGSRSPLVTECADAAAAILESLGKTAGRDVQIGDGTDGDRMSWGGVPPGCSIQSRGDWAPHFNMGSGSNNGYYSMICTGVIDGSTAGSSAEHDAGSSWAKAFVAVIVVGAVAAIIGLVVYKRRIAHSRAIAGQAEGTSLQPVANAPTFVVGVPLASQGDTSNRV